MSQDVNNKVMILKRILIYGVLLFIFPTMLFLTYYSFRYSIGAVDIPFDTIMMETKDSLFIHLAVMAVWMLSVFLVQWTSLHKKLEEKWIKLYIYGIMVATFIVCLSWVLNGNFYAQNDSRSVLNSLLEIRNGDYTQLTPKGYIGAHKHQLGILTLINIIFTLTGSTDEIVIQLFNVLCVPGIIYVGYRILQEMMAKSCIFLYYGVIALFSFPLFLYTPYVYGEIISITAGMVFVWAGLCYLKRGKVSAWIALLVSSVVGNLARGNFPVLLIAFAIMAVLYAVRHKKIKLCLCAISLFLAVFLANLLNVRYYEAISGIKLDQGIPIEGFLAMGLNEDEELSYGMHNGYHVQTYAEAGYDAEKAKLDYRRFIKDRINMFRNGAGTNPLTFYKGKILLQWNDPTFNCFMENRTFIPEAHPVIKNIVEPEGSYATVAREVLNQYHFMLYLGMLFYCMSLFRSKVPFYNMILPIILTGGILLTIIWEAMSRYVLPYAIYMIPLSAIGWFCFGNMMCRTLAKGRTMLDKKNKR